MLHAPRLQVFLVASDGSQGSTAGAQSALKAAISCVRHDLHIWDEWLHIE